MTKEREPLTYERTLVRVAELIGYDQCGHICGVSPRQVRNWSDHDCQQQIRMIDAERLDAAFLDAGGDHGPFHRLMALRLEISQRDAEARCLAGLAQEAAKEGGEAISAMIEASNNLADPRVRRRMRKEVEEAMAPYVDGLATLDRIEAEQARLN